MSAQPATSRPLTVEQARTLQQQLDERQATHVYADNVFAPPTLADFECEHGRLASDRPKPGCRCFR